MSRAKDTPSPKIYSPIPELLLEPEIEERLATTDPFSYEPRKDDPPWVTQKS